MKILIKASNVNMNMLLDYINDNFIRLVNMQFCASSSIIQSDCVTATYTVLYTLTFESCREETLRKFLQFLQDVCVNKQKMNLMDYCWIK